jgi:hypothetical protein
MSLINGMDDIMTHIRNLELRLEKKADEADRAWSIVQSQADEVDRAWDIAQSHVDEFELIESINDAPVDNSGGWSPTSSNSPAQEVAVVSQGDEGNQSWEMVQDLTNGQQVEPYDEKRCKCRIWNVGMGGQCTNNPKKDGEVCGTHSKSMRQDGDQLVPPLGWIYEPRPNFIKGGTRRGGRYGEGSPIDWEGGSSLPMPAPARA